MLCLGDNFGMGQAAEMFNAGDWVEFRVFEDPADAEACARCASRNSDA